MLQWLKSIGDFLVMIIDFIVSFFQNVIEIVQLIIKGFGAIVTTMAYMPAQYSAFALALISFSVIVAIIHFGG